MPFKYTGLPWLVCPGEHDGGRQVDCHFVTKKLHKWREHLDEVHKGRYVRPIVKAEMDSQPLVLMEAKAS